MQKKAFLLAALLSALGILLCGQKTQANSYVPAGESFDPGLPPPLAFSPTTVPDGLFGSAYTNQTLTVTGGMAPYTFSVSSGSLPPGMSISSDGIISGTPTTAGSYSFTVTALDNSPGPPGPGPNSGTQDYTLVVDQAVLTVTAGNAAMTYGGAFPVLSVSYGGFVNGDNASSLTTAPTIATTATPSSPAGAYSITAFGGADPNYNIVYNPGTLTIAPAALTITANDASMVYGGTVPSLSVSYTGFVNGDNASSLTTAPTITTTANSASPAGPYPITATGAVDPNYTFTYQAGTMTVGKAALTVTADDKSMPLGGPLPALTVSYSGFVNGDVASSLTTPPTATTAATATSPAGSYAITPGGGASANYTFSYVNGTLSVAKATLTITASPSGSVYGAALVSAGSLTVSYSGFVNGDGPGSMTAAPIVTNTASAGSPVGSYALLPSGAANPNYTIQYVNGVYTISPAALTVTAVSQNMTYGGTVPSLSVSYTGFVNGDNASSLTTAPTITTTANSASPAGPYPITATGAVDPNYTFTYQAGTMTVGKAALTVTADDKSMPLGGPLPALTVSYSGFVNGDVASSLTTPPTATTAATATSPAGSYAITPGGGASANYTFSYVNGTLSVAKATLTITASPSGSVYGAALVSAGSLTVSYSGFVNGDGPGSMTAAPIVTNTASAGSPVGSYALLPSGAANPNYTIQYVNGVYTISPAALTVTAVSQNMTYGGTVPSLSVSYTGFVNGDNASRLTTAPTVTTTASSASPAGPYPITATGAVDPNYTFTYQAGTMTVQRAALTVTANPASITYGGIVPALAVSYTGFVNGDNASRLTTPPAITTTATSSSPAGGYPITASGAVDPNYTFTYLAGTLTVGKATLTVTADSKSMALGGPLPPLTISYSGFVNGDNATGLTTLPTASTPATVNSPAGTYPITPGGGASSNYIFSYVTGILSVGKALLTITANPSGSVYGAALVPAGSLTVSYSGFVNGDGPSSLAVPPVVTNTAFAAAPVGSYTLIPSGAVSTNYNIQYVNGAYAIGPAALAVTAANQTMTYGAAVPALTASYSGFVNGDNVSRLTNQPTITTTAISSSPAGAYPITASGAVDPNYTITYQAGTMTVQRAALTVTANPASMTYGGTVPALAVSYAGFVNGDNVSSLTASPTITTTATSSSPAGGYPIAATGAADPNYTITYQTGTLTVGKATLTATADNKSMPLGGPVPALTITYTGFVNGDNVSSLTTLPTATTTATAASPAGTYPIIPNGGVSSNYTFSYVNGILAVAKAFLTITANNTGSVYGAALVPGGSLTVSYSGFANGDGPGSMTVPPIVTNTASAGAAAGSYTLIPSGAVNPNYAIQYVNGTYTISPATLTITGVSQTMTYGGAAPALTVAYSGFVNGDNASRLTTLPTARTAAGSISPAGVYPITASGAVDPNYSFVYNTGVLTINPAGLQVTAKPQTKAFGAVDPVFTYNVTGLVNGDNAGIFTGSLSRAAGENVGTYPITLGSLSAGGNYTIGYTGNLLTITKAAQQITWGQSLSVGCNDTTLVLLTATASSGLAVTYSVSDTTVATVSGHVLTLLKPGTAVVTARQAGDANHTAAAPVADTLFYQAASLIRQHWSDAIFFDNSSGDYVQWQWYKNGDAVAGATSPFFSETPSLNGQYFVIATTQAGQQIQSCTLSITGGAAIPGGIKAYPNPANVGARITVTSDYPSTALKSAVLQVVDLTGKVRQQLSNVEPSMQLTMPSETGIYIINLVLANGQRASVNVLVTAQ